MDSNHRFSLNRSQLKYIAVISMVIDHIAWGFVDFHSPLGQFMHVCGRLTIPIMSFFIAEGFKHTHDLKKYIYRMAGFAALTIIPFYVFFGFEYGYRQNIIFDYLLGLLILTVLEHRPFAKWQKAALVTLLFAVSLAVGGWPVTPLLFILGFYYGRTFREKVKWFIIADVGTVIFLEICIVIDDHIHLTDFGWVWWDRFYLLGFMLALPLLYFYNGQKGRDILGRHFFYYFYPSHFAVLALIRMAVLGQLTTYGIYLGIHIVIFLGIILILSKVMTARPTRGQNAICFFLMSAAIYTIGFILEIISTTSQGYFLACMVQYTGEFILMIALLLFVSECCMIKLPMFLYVIHAVISVILMYMLLMTRETHLFYSSIGVETAYGMLKPALEHAVGFYLTYAFLILINLEVIGIAVYTLIHGAAIERKRVRLIIIATVFFWVPYLITLTGITGGFEVPGLGMLVAGFLLCRCFFSYGALDSVALASENALDKAHEGILVLDERYRISFHNALVDDIIGDLPHNVDVRRYEHVRDILEGKTRQITIRDHIYDVQVEEMKQSGMTQGYMIWALDVTEHMRNMDRIREIANHDPLTGLFNRTHFKELVDQDVDAGRMGCFLMMDMDNFKQINDCYGHQRGDSVLKNLADILNEYPQESVYACRVGGDEFCAWLRDTVDLESIKTVIDHIMNSFGRTFRADDDIVCTISIGAVINNNTEMLLDCSTMYSVADGKLYEAKESGKNTYRI